MAFSNVLRVFLFRVSVILILPLNGYGAWQDYFFDNELHQILREKNPSSLREKILYLRLNDPDKIKKLMSKENWDGQNPYLMALKLRKKGHLDIFYHLLNNDELAGSEKQAAKTLEYVLKRKGGHFPRIFDRIADYTDLFYQNEEGDFLLETNLSLLGSRENIKIQNSLILIDQINRERDSYSEVKRIQFYHQALETMIKRKQNKIMISLIDHFPSDVLVGPWKGRELTLKGFPNFFEYCLNKASDEMIRSLVKKLQREDILFPKGQAHALVLLKANKSIPRGRRNFVFKELLRKLNPEDEFLFSGETRPRTIMDYYLNQEKPDWVSYSKLLKNYQLRENLSDSDQKIIEFIDLMVQPSRDKFFSRWEELTKEDFNNPLLNKGSIFFKYLSKNHPDKILRVLEAWGPNKLVLNFPLGKSIFKTFLSSRLSYSLVVKAIIDQLYESTNQPEKIRKILLELMPYLERFYIFDDDPYFIKIEFLMGRIDLRDHRDGPYKTYERLKRHAELSYFPDIKKFKNVLLGDDQIPFIFNPIQLRSFFATKDRIPRTHLPKQSGYEEFESMVKNLDNRMNKGVHTQKAKEKIERMTGMKYEALRNFNLNSEFVKGLFDNTDKNLPPLVGKLRAITAALYKSSTEIKSGELFSDQQKKLIFLGSELRDCQKRQKSGILRVYTVLDESDKIQTCKDYLKDEGGELGEAELELKSLLRGHVKDFFERQLMAEGPFLRYFLQVIGHGPLTQGPHQEQFLINILGPQLGLISRPSFDPYTRIVDKALLRARPKEILEKFFEFLDPETLLISMANYINKTLIQDEDHYQHIIQVIDRVIEEYPADLAQDLFDVDDEEETYYISKNGAGYLLIGLSIIRPFLDPIYEEKKKPNHPISCVFSRFSKKGKGAQDD